MIESVTVPLKVSVSTLSDVGRRRQRNEDAIGSDEADGLLVVADGMGGHPAGHVASRLAVEEALESLRNGSRSRDGEETSQRSRSAAGDRMAEAVRSADRRIRTEGLRDPERAGMGTTLTVLHLNTERGTWHIGHVGDSRAYRFRDGTLEQLTRDDTWVQSQVEAGRIKPENARNHPWGSLLSQAVGLEQPAEPSVLEGETGPGDVFLLCSDGLLAHLADPELADLLRDHLKRGLEDTARALVDAANRRGGIDNITVGLLRVEEA